MRTSLICFTLFLNVANVNSQVRTKWVTIFNLGSYGHEQILGMFVDNSGNVLVSGNYSPNIPFVDYGNFLTAKCDSNGIEQWVAHWSSGGTDIGNSVAGDAHGNLVITGYSEGSTSSDDYVTVKYNSNGDVIWVRGYNGPSNSIDRANAVAADKFGNIYITGGSTGIGTGYDFVTLKYNSIGALRWLKRHIGEPNGDDISKSIVVDNWRNVIVLGESTGGSVFIKYDSLGTQLWTRKISTVLSKISVDSTGNILMLGQNILRKFDVNGDSLWSLTLQGQINSFAVDNNANIYVVGSLYSSVSGYDVMTLKIDSTGNVIWIKTYNGYGNQDDGAISVTVDRDGGVFATGSSIGYQIGTGVITLKYDSSGSQQWVRFYEGSDREDFNGASVAVDELGNVYVAGQYVDHFWPLLKYFAIKYSPSNLEVNLQLSVLMEGFYNETNNALIQDTVYVYLRDSGSPHNIIDTARALLSSQGTASFTFSNADNVIPFYVVVKHRNSLETWSSVPLSFSDNQLTYEFTSGSHLAYGYNLVLKGSKYCMYSGDVNNDGTIDASDLAIVDNDALNSSLGYAISDVNGDYFVDGSDLVIVDNNSYNFIGVIRP